MYVEGESIVRRYADSLSVSNNALSVVSAREGVQVVSLGNYSGVDIDALDMSSLTSTGTFKDWVASYVLCKCLDSSIESIVGQSSGNTANALAFYAARAGVKATILYPSVSRARINADTFDSAFVRFFEVDEDEHIIKRLVVQISESNGSLLVPSFEEQMVGNGLRARFLADASLQLGVSWDWHVQSISSAYGPLGFYRLADRLAGFKVPKFLGIQQEAVSPYYDALTGSKPADVSMLEPTLFRRRLSGDLVERLRSVVRNGGLARVSNEIYRRREGPAIDMLAAHGLEAELSANGQPFERSGLYALVGCLEAVDNKLIPHGARALVALTGGLSRTVKRQNYIPDRTWRAPELLRLLA